MDTGKVALPPVFFAQRAQQALTPLLVLPLALPALLTPTPLPSHLLAPLALPVALRQRVSLPVFAALATPRLALAPPYHVVRVLQASTLVRELRLVLRVP